MKTSRWTSPAYAISFSSTDCIFVDVVVDIIEKVGLRTLTPEELDRGLEPEASNVYEAKIRECQLNPLESGYALSLAKRLSTEEMTKAHDELCSLLLADINPSLHSLFYSGDIIPNEI